jgi:hypothetical protein
LNVYQNQKQIDFIEQKNKSTSEATARPTKELAIDT